MATYSNGDNVTALAARLRNEAVIPGRSLFTDRPIWTGENFSELRRAYVDRPDQSASSFEVKLQAQLDDATDDGKILFAELLLLNLIILGNVTARHKLHLIRIPLDMVQGAPVDIPSDVIDVLERGGVLNGGQGVNLYRWQAMAYLVEWGEALSALDEDERRDLFTDSEAVERLVYGPETDVTNLAMQRSLCYLFDPTGHEPIISQVHLKQITKHFSLHVPGELSEARMQRQAAAIRHSLAEERGDTEWDFYHDRDEWQQTTTPPPTATAPEADAAEHTSTDPVIVDFSEDLADNLFVDHDWLHQLQDTLNAKRQIVLQGPPGTGKTYMARRLARAATTTDDQVEIVQFHPAYTYEDFFEGFRPQASEDGAAHFVLRPGPLRKLADRAAADADRPYFLVIDEINRGNLAKIFGELYFLLEYRDDAVRLMYSQDEFILPSNLFIIGTMNTADRSIALVDSAMRRRFAFFRLAPDRKPVSEVLSRWTAGDPRRNIELPGLLTALNAMVANPDRMVGPSYLMQNSAQSPDGLVRVWETEILPLLQETFYGDDDVASRFSLTSVRKSVADAATLTESTESARGVEG